VTETSIPPLQLSISVKAPLALTFGASVVIGKPPRKRVMLEPRLGGRCFEISHHETRTVVAKIIVWEPPERVVFLWHVCSSLQPDKELKSEVEVRFEMDSGVRHPVAGIMREALA
jgi:hypothetical protein